MIIIPAPTQNPGEWHAIILGVSTPLSRHHCVCYLSPSPLAFLLPVSTLQTVAHDGGWGSSSSSSSYCCGCCTVGDAVSLPVVLLSSPSLLLLLVCPLAMLLPVSTLQAVACSGSWPLLSCPSTHDPPREQCWAAAVGVIVSLPCSHCAPHFYPESRGLEWWCGRRRC